MICQALDFHHLPVAGGIYDQHPDLITQWLELFAVKDAADKAKEAKRGKK